MSTCICNFPWEMVQSFHPFLKGIYLDSEKQRTNSFRTNWGMCAPGDYAQFPGGMKAWKGLRTSIFVPQLSCASCAKMDLSEKRHVRKPL